MSFHERNGNLLVCRCNCNCLVLQSLAFSELLWAVTYSMLKLGPPQTFSDIIFYYMQVENKLQICLVVHAHLESWRQGNVEIRYCSSFLIVKLWNEQVQCTVHPGAWAIRTFFSPRNIRALSHMHVWQSSNFFMKDYSSREPLSNSTLVLKGGEAFWHQSVTSYNWFPKGLPTVENANWLFALPRK